jgi:hypothetical protein
LPRRSGYRALRALGWAVVSLCALVVLAAFGVPLVVRGPVLAGLVEHASGHLLCGSIRLTGGHVSLNVVPALLLARPFEVVLEGADLREPNQSDLFNARTVRARMTLHRPADGPIHLVVESLQVSDGGWRLHDEGVGQPLTQVFRRRPSGDRAACLRPPPPAAQKPPAPPAKLGPVLTVQSTRLQRMSVVLSFPMWEVDLDRADAHGTVELRNAPSGPQILFDVRDVHARRGGALRVGPRSATTPRFPFDNVDIPRVAVTADAPQHLLLTVAEGRTGDAVLSGHARFTNVFAPPASHLPAGMELDARWTNLGRPLEQNAAWRDVGKGLARQRTSLKTELNGPFETLTGYADLAGRDFSVRAGLLSEGRYKLNVRFDDLDTTPFVPKGQRELLAGRLDGRVALSARIGGANPTASLDAIELALQRTTAGGLPGRWVVSRSFRARSADELRLDLGKVGLDGGTARIEAFRVSAPAAQFGGRLRAERQPASDELKLRLWSEPGARFAWQGETFLPPPLVAARVEPGRAVTIEPFSVQHVGGGAIDAGATLRANGPAEIKLAVRAYPLARLPGLSHARAPGRPGTVGALLRGQLDAALALAGRPQRPSLSGTLALSRVQWAGQGLGGGRIDFTGLPGGTRFQGQLLDGIQLSGTLHPSPKADDAVTVALRDLALRPLLPPKLAPLDPRASGEISWSRSGDEIRVARLAVSARGAQANATGLLKLDRRDPRASPVSATVRARVDGRSLASALTPKLAGGGSANIDAALSGTIAAASIRGQAQLQGLTVSWPQSPFGTVRIDGPLRMDDRTLAIGPLQATFQSGGWVKISGVRGNGTVVMAQPGASLPVSAVDVTVQGSGITTAHPVAGLSLNGLALGVRLTQPNATALQAGGWIYLGHDFFQLKKGKEKPKPKSETGKPKPAPNAPSLADHIWTRLQIVGPEEAMTIGVPWVPDVTLDANCVIEGPLSAPHLAGSIEGSGLYSRVALTVADWFTSRDLRGCDLGPQ